MDSWNSCRYPATNRELARLQWVHDTQGYDELVRFARQGMTVYLKALRTPYGKAYRYELLASLLVYRKLLRTMGRRFV